MENTRVTVTFEIPNDTRPRGQVRFAGVVFYDRGAGGSKCGDDRVPESIRPRMIRMLEVANG